MTSQKSHTACVEEFCKRLFLLNFFPQSPHWYT